ncbi:MAG TPA: M28 family peptidase, partial [Candidatus Binatia bacterium]
PPFPLASTRAMINLDMVGRMKDNKVTVASVDSAKEFRALLERAGRAAGGLNVEMKPRGGATDHVSFYNEQVPAVHFYTGMHPDYHRPSDKWEKLNIEGMARVGDMVLSLVNEIAAAGEGLTFVKLPSSRDGRPPPAKNP